MQQEIEIRDTLRGELTPLPSFSKEKPLKIFVCGPTVYDFIHIGNARTYLVFDALVKYLRATGVNVFYLQNITDVDDKIIIRGEREKITAVAVAKKYQKAYFDQMKELGITSVDTYAPATEFIPQIVDQVERLVEKGHVYKTDDGYYFDLSTFPDYGKLARRTASQADDGMSRIDESVVKKNRGDFCVWKFSKPGEPSWETGLGKGRPGWHIEDTAISEHFFGPQYDIHGGGVDLKFPHHEAEIAQQESASGKKPFVKIWMHVGSLTVNNRKMSKSLGNFVTLTDFLKNHKPEVLRLIALSNHYRTPLNYTEEMGDIYNKLWKNIQETLWRFDFVSGVSSLPDVKTWDEKRLFGDPSVKDGKAGRTEFYKALANDFNTPQALGIIYSFEGSKFWEHSRESAKRIRDELSNMLLALGFEIKPLKIPLKVKTLIRTRETAKKNQQFIQSDELRKQINGLGYNLDDTPLGQFVRPQ